MTLNQTPLLASVTEREGERVSQQILTSLCRIVQAPNVVDKRETSPFDAHEACSGHSTRLWEKTVTLGLRRMACHEQASGASNGYRAWIRTMNNASKGRCVTVTPRGKARTKYLRQNPVFARGNIVPGTRQKNHFKKITKNAKTDLTGGNRGNRDVGGVFLASGDADLPLTRLSRRKFHGPTLTDLVLPWQVRERILVIRLRAVDRDLSLCGVPG
jgi:hypothetical protein